MNEALDPVATATLRLEAAVERLTRAASARPAAVRAAEDGAPGVDPTAVAALAARLDETIARLRSVLGEDA